MSTHRRWRRWLWLITSLGVLQFSLAFGLASLVIRGEREQPDWTHVAWVVSSGHLGVRIPHEIVGQFPQERWKEFLNGTGTTLGFGFLWRSHGYSHSYTSATFIVIPFWFPVLLSGFSTAWCIKRDGLVVRSLPSLRRRRRGFEPVMNSPPLPAARIEGSASSSRGS